MDLIEVDIGFDRFQAQVIADHCADQGVRGELLVFDETRYELGMSGRVPNRFLVRAHDEPIVRGIMADLYPDLAFGLRPDVVAAASTEFRRHLLQVGVSVLIAGPLLFALVYLLS